MVPNPPIPDIIHSVRIHYHAEAKFYKSYHQNHINWWIHTVTVPIEWFSFFLLVQYTRVDAVICLSISGIIAAYYLLISCPAASAAAYGMVLTSWCSIFIKQLIPPEQLWILALVLHFVAWFSQVVIGHYMVEKNSPAMGQRLTANSVVLSFLLAWDYSD